MVLTNVFTSTLNQRHKVFLIVHLVLPPLHNLVIDTTSTNILEVIIHLIMYHGDMNLPVLPPTECFWKLGEHPEDPESSLKFFKLTTTYVAVDRSSLI